MQLFPFDPIPDSEISKRIQTLKKEMAGSGLKAVLLTHTPDIYYFSGTAQDAYLYVGKDQDPVLFVKRYLPRALRESPLALIEPIESVKDIPGRIRARFKSLPASCGLTFDVVPVKEFRFFETLFPGTTFKDGTPLIEACRQIKSAFEIEKMEASALVSQKTFDFMAKNIRPGFTEMEFCGMFETYSRSLGHSGKLLTRSHRTKGFPFHVMSGKNGGIPGALDSPVCGTGTSNAYPYGAGPKPLEENEPILIDFGTVKDGYHVDETRMFVMGKMPDQAEKAGLAAIDILCGIQEKMKPGVTLGKIFDAAVVHAERIGLGEAFLGLPGLKSRFIGHGVGLELVESPIISKGSKTILKPGMVFALEPKFIFFDAYAAGVESMVLITETGSRFLSRTENKIFYC